MGIGHRGLGGGAENRQVEHVENNHTAETLERNKTVRPLSAIAKEVYQTQLVIYPAIFPRLCS